jgi:hypothetical protein
MWIPDLSTISGPRYKAIAEALATDLRNGKLKAGDRLPTHRDLAYRLGVTVGTITRAYAEAQRRGLLEGHVGRGSFLAQPVNLPAGFGVVDHDQSGLIELSLAFPPPQANDVLLQRAFADLARQPGVARLLDYQPHGGMAHHRAAAAAEVGSAIRWAKNISSDGPKNAFADLALARCGRATYWTDPDLSGIRAKCRASSSFASEAWPRRRGHSARALHLPCPRMQRAPLLQPTARSALFGGAPQAIAAVSKLVR